MTYQNNALLFRVLRNHELYSPDDVIDAMDYACKNRANFEDHEWSMFSELVLEIKWHPPYAMVIKLGETLQKDITPGLFADLISYYGYQTALKMLNQLDEMASKAV